MIGVNGLGRIGRILVQRLAAEAPQRLCALNDPADLQTLVHLLRHDSVHRPSPMVVTGEKRSGRDWLRVADLELPLFHEPDPGSIPFESCGATLVVEASGRFTGRDAAARHLRGSVEHVIISAPGKDADITIIAPVNFDALDLSQHRIISNASCTAHATAPMLRVLEEAFGIEAAGMSTVHVVTNDQRLADAPHKDLRRARHAFLSIIPTTSSAFGALHKALPGLPPGFSGSALRVPTLSVNLVDITATLKRDVDAAAVNQAFLDAAAALRWRGILDLAEPECVSRDFIGRTESVVMDLQLTRVLGNRFVKVCGWHDNETGYAERLAELVLTMEIEETTNEEHGRK
ncbi:MAG: type I glyceraldehyde-3-phosphate dehydrogenase [Holophagaceae bacterium]|nr:type I glyceraldehyde-3-phosphate dehydrogenase [Holophagaceae bacterium]